MRLSGRISQILVAGFCACSLLLGDVKAPTSMAADLLAKGRVDDSIAALQKTIGASPQDAQAYNLLCRAYYSIENWDRGISACEKAVAIEPNNSMYHLWLGRVYGEKADNVNFLSAASLAKKARVQFETAVQLNPENVEARSDLSEYYIEAPGIMGGGTDKAEAQAQAIEKLFPAKAHWIRARIAEKRKDYATAEKGYKEAIQSHDTSATWLDLASFYRHRERMNEMEDALAHAVAGKVDPPEALMEAAESLIKTGRNLPKAAELLRRYISSGNLVEEAPAFKAHYLLGSVLERQGDKKGAAQEYSVALSMAKDYSVARVALDRVHG